MSQDEAKKELRQKVFAILKSGQPSEVIPALFQIEPTVSQTLKSMIRQPILYVFENQHDWDGIMKCIRHWKAGPNKWTRDFYERMKKRFEENPDSNLPDHQLIPEINKLIIKHQAVYGKRNSIVPNLEKYLKKEEKEDDKNSVKSGHSVKSLQSIKSIQSIKSNPVAQTKPPMSFSLNSFQAPKPIQTSQTIKSISPTPIPNSNQKVKENDSNQSISSAQSLKPTKSFQSISSVLQTSTKTEVSRPEMPKISRMTEHSGQEKSKEGLKSLQKSVDLKKPAMALNIVKKPNLGLLRKQEGMNSNSNPVAKHPKRLTFGISDELRSNLRLSKPEAQETEKKIQIELKPVPKAEQNKTSNENVNIVNKQTNPADKKGEEPQKSNIFDRKEEVVVPIRVNPVFATERKDTNANQLKSSQVQEKSVSRSITPHKPLIQRKKIILKKPADYKPTVVSDDDSFEMDDDSNVVSYMKDDEDKFFSEEKITINESAVEEVEQLKKEIQSENRHPVKDIRQNPEKSVEAPKKQIPQVQSSQQNKKPDKKIQQKSSSVPQILKQSSQFPHPSMIRREDQLFSEYEISLMGFNPREETSDVNIYKIVKKLGLNLSEQHNKVLDNELEKIRRAKAARPRRTKL